METSGTPERIAPPGVIFLPEAELLGFVGDPGVRRAVAMLHYTVIGPEQREDLGAVVEGIVRNAMAEPPPSE